MKTFKGLLFVGLLTVGSAFGLGACSDDTDTTTSTTTTSSSSSTGSSSSSSTGSSSSGGGLSIEGYCTAIMANCTGANAQYGDAAQCTAAGMMFDMGTEGETSGDTLGCRDYHADAAKTDAALHCAHAGPFGGDACGALCDNFCKLATATCKTEYPTAAACMTDCMGYAKMPAYSYQATGDNYACRAYHLTAAVADAATHCPHTGKMSSVCVP